MSQHFPALTTSMARRVSLTTPSSAPRRIQSQRPAKRPIHQNDNYVLRRAITRTPEYPKDASSETIYDAMPYEAVQDPRARYLKPNHRSLPAQYLTSDDESEFADQDLDDIEPPFQNQDSRYPFFAQGDGTTWSAYCRGLYMPTRSAGDNPARSGLSTNPDFIPPTFRTPRWRRSQLVRQNPNSAPFLHLPPPEFPRETDSGYGSASNSPRSSNFPSQTTLGEGQVKSSQATLADLTRQEASYNNNLVSQPRSRVPHQEVPSNGEINDAVEKLTRVLSFESGEDVLNTCPRAYPKDYKRRDDVRKTPRIISPQRINSCIAEIKDASGGYVYDFGPKEKKMGVWERIKNKLANRWKGKSMEEHCEHDDFGPVQGPQIEQLARCPSCSKDAKKPRLKRTRHSCRTAFD